MTITLEPILSALGYDTPAKQRAMVALLEAAGAFGQLPYAHNGLTDRQAEAVLKHVTFDSPEGALDWLHDLTQETMLRRPKGVERHECYEPEPFKQNRAQLLSRLHEAGVISDVKPKSQHYDHVLVLGSMEGSFNGRLETLRELHDQGVRFDAVHLLGSNRELDPAHEPIANVDIGGKKLSTEMQMMAAHYYERQSQWPDELKNVPVHQVNSFGTPGARANTLDTAKTWLNTKPKPGKVLVISSQPHVGYQHEAVKAALSPRFEVESVGSRVPEDGLKISVALDDIARQIDVGYERLKEVIQSRPQYTNEPIMLLNPGDIKVDADTYQFRSGGDAKGVTKHSCITADKWDPILHGDPLLVHERLDGSHYVADGHHRLALAKKLNLEGKGPKNVAVMVLREADGYSPKDVKIIAAYKNIQHGKTNVIDTARVFKEAQSPDVHKELLPLLDLDKGNLMQALQLSTALSSSALDDLAKKSMLDQQAQPAVVKAPQKIIEDKAYQNIKQLLSRGEANLGHAGKVQQERQLTSQLAANR